MEFIRDPLLHFVVAGGLLFGAHSWLGDKPRDESLEPVRIDSGKIGWLKNTFTSQWLREPDHQELEGLVADLVTEELLAREARAMGLDQDDTIVRRRLAQKLKFLIEDTVNVVEPAEADLRTYYEANLHLFRIAGKASFRQVYFNPEGRKDAAADASDLLGKLQAGGAGDVAEAGDRFLLGTEFEGLDEQEAGGIFGEALAHEIYAAPTASWVGPFKSGYGYHLINVSRRTEPRFSPFEQARESVLLEWLRKRQAEISLDYIDRLREQYGVVFDDDVSPLVSDGQQAEAELK